MPITLVADRALTANIDRLNAPQTYTGVKTFTPAVTAAAAIARGTVVTPALTAAANNDALIGLDVTPTFNAGVLTGVTRLAARLNGGVQVGPTAYPSWIGNDGLYVHGSFRAGAYFINDAQPIVWGDSLSTIRATGGAAGSLTIKTNNIDNFKIFSTGNLVLQNTTQTDVASSKLTITSTTQGMLAPRMTKAQRDAIASPAQGLQVFVTDTGGYMSFFNVTWQKVTSVAD